MRLKKMTMSVQAAIDEMVISLGTERTPEHFQTLNRLRNIEASIVC